MKDIEKPKKKHTFKEKIANYTALLIAIAILLLCIALIPICCYFFNKNIFLLDNILLPLLISLISGDIIYISINETIEIQNKKEKDQRAIIAINKLLPRFYELSTFFQYLYKSTCSNDEGIFKEIIKFPLKNTSTIITQCKNLLDINVEVPIAYPKVNSNGSYEIQHFLYEHYVEFTLIDFKKNLNGFLSNYGVFLPTDLLNELELLSKSIVLIHGEYSIFIGHFNSAEDLFRIIFSGNFSKIIDNIIEIINKITKKENFQTNSEVSHIAFGIARLVLPPK